jgi:hypothetical protein
MKALESVLKLVTVSVILSAKGSVLEWAVVWALGLATVMVVAMEKV